MGGWIGLGWVEGKEVGGLGGEEGGGGLNALLLYACAWVWFWGGGGSVGEE